MKKFGLDIDIVEKARLSSLGLKKKMACDPTGLCILLYNLIKRNSSGIDLIKLNFRISELDIHTAYDIAITIKKCKNKKIEFIAFTEYLSLSHLLAISYCDFRICPPLTGPISFSLNFKHFFVNKTNAFTQFVKIGDKKLSLIDFTANNISESTFELERKLGEEIITRCINIIVEAIPQEKNLKTHYSTAVELLESNLLTHTCYEEYIFKNVNTLKDIKWRKTRFETFDINSKWSKIIQLFKKSFYIITITSTYWEDIHALDTLHRQLKYLANFDRARGILLIVNYKGGSYEAADRIWCLINYIKKKATIYVYIKVATSSGYCIASQGDKVFINPCGYLGSIGTIMFSVNYDKILEQMGIEVINNIASPLGTQPDDLDVLSKKSRIAFTLFINRIAQARQMDVEIVKRLMDGSSFNSEKSVESNFADIQGCFASVLDQIEVSLSKKIRFVFIRETENTFVKFINELSLSSIIKTFIR